MPQYAVLIYEGVAVEDLPKEIMDGHMNLPDRIAEAGGRVVAGLALQDQSTATGIRDGLLTDGPFMETKEQLGGFIFLEVRDLDEALEWAARTPWNGPGHVTEIRPVMDYDRYAERAAS